MFVGEFIPITEDACKLYATTWNLSVSVHRCSGGGDVLKSTRWTSPRSWSQLRVSQTWYPLQDRLDGEFNWLMTHGRQRGFLYCKADLLKISKCLNKKSSEKICSKLVCKCLRFLMALFSDAPCQCHLVILAVSRNRELPRCFSV